MQDLIRRIENPQGKLRKALCYLLIAFAGFILIAYLFRTPLASWYLHRRIDRFNRENPATLAIQSVRIRGVASALVTGITLKPSQGDTLLKIDTAYASVGILKLFAGRLALHKVRLIHTSILLEKQDSATNYGFLLKSRRHAGDSLSEPVNYAGTIDRLSGIIFDKIPLSLEMRNFSLAAVIDGHRTAFHIDRFTLEDHYFRSAVKMAEDTTVSEWIVAGRIDNGDRMAQVRLYPADTTRSAIPFLGYRWNARVGFDTLSFSISAKTGDDDLTHVSGYASVKRLTVDHRKIAAGAVTFEKLSVDYRLNFGKDFAELDSASEVVFNRISLHPYLRYRAGKQKQITLRMNKPQFPAQDLFSSFPQGLFTNLDGLRVQGNLSWHLFFDVDLSNPDSLQFETSLDRQGFRVLSYGNADLTKINGSFLYTAYEHDLPVRTFMVGPENPNFRTLSHISPFLQAAVLTSEDGGFYQHRGFLPDAFRESIATNIKEHRFARGGSTISMQLVKNVFLSRNKTIARKLEEALIVWLIENQGLSTKDRMYEVYLNIIEWGPLIYGANEASRYYFNKDASKLTLAEAIYLASIIPRPKWFKYNFTEDGHLRESLAEYYRLVSGKMVSKGWITPSDTDKLIPDVELKGPARLLLKQADSIPADTTEEE